MKKHYKNFVLLFAFTLWAGYIHAQITVDATAGTLSSSYATLKAAFDAINNGTHQGAIDIRVHANTTETDSCRLDASGTGGLSSYTSVLIRPADTATVAKVIATSVSGRSLIYLNGAGNVTIDGRPLGVGSQRLLSFLHTNPNANVSSCSIRMINGVFSTTICYINSTLSTTMATAASVNISLSTSVSSVGNNRISISNCNIVGGVQGINMTGTLANFMDSISITNNLLTNNQGSGIIANAIKTLILDSNTISHTASFAGWNVIGVNLNPNVSGGSFTITRNNIFNLQTGSVAQLYGLFLNPTTAGLAVNPTVTMTNNNISLLATNAGLTFARAMQFQGAGNITFVGRHNTFRLGGSGAGTTGNPASVTFVKSNSATTTSYTFTNNICINTRTGAANPHIAYWNSTPTVGTNITDFNNLHGPVFIAIANGNYQNNLTAYRTASFPNEQNSTFGILDFVNNNLADLSVTGINNTGAKLVGTPSTVTTDIYGTTRNVTRPFKGAFEGPASLITNNDLQTVITYTFGKIPTGTIDTARAVIRNVGTSAAVNVPVYLHSSLNGLIGSVLVNIASGAQATINLPPYTPTILGFDTLWVFPAPDQLAANDTFIWVRENTLNALSYTRPFVNQFGNIGTNPDGEIVAKFSTPVPNFINQVNVNFTNPNFTGPWPFQIVIYPDSGGTNGPSRNPLYVSSTQNTINGIFNLSLPSIPISGSFYVGVRQTSSNNIGFAYQNENPIRNTTFYFRQGVGYQTLAWNDFAVNDANQFRFMIEPRLKINDDLGVIGILAPQAGCADTSTSRAVRVTVQNLGLLSQNFGITPLQVFGTITNPANVTSNFGPITISSGTLASDDTISVELTPNYNMGVTGNYVIRAWSQLSVDNNKVNDTLPNTTRIVTLPFSAPYTQTFNAAATLPAEITTNRFVVTANVGVNNTNAARVNLANATPFNANAYLLSPRITGVTADTRLRFDYRIINFTGGGATVLTNVDSMNILVSTDCGETFTTVATVVGTAHVPSTGFTTMEIPLSAYVGQNVRVKIQFDWFGTTNNAFVDIDNIRILNVTSDLSATASSAPCAAIIAGGSAAAPVATFKNTGTTTLTGVNVSYIVTGPASYSGSGSIASLSPNDITSVTFTPVFTPTAAGTYTAKIFSTLTADSDPLNDTFYHTFIVVNTTAANAGTALSFSGTTSAEVTNLSTINLSGNTISMQAWINRNAAGTGNRTIISKDSSIIKGQYALWLNAANNLVFTLTTSAGANAVVSANPLPAGTYTHIAATYDGAVMSVYINGNLEGTVAHTGTIAPNLVTLKIGHNYNNERFVGEIDELQIWNSVLDVHSIRSNMHKRTPNAFSANLLAYFRFDEGAGALSVDASGNCNTVNLTAGAWPTWIAATYPLVLNPVTDIQVVALDGPKIFTGTGLTINYTGFTGFDSVYVHKISGAPLGTSPVTLPGGVTAVHPNSWIAYRYGSGTFTSANLIFELGAGNLTSTVNTSDLLLFNRANGANGAWTALNTGATAASFALQSVTFGQSTPAFFARQLAIGANSNPLPVKLIYFNGKRNNADVELTWVTASETDNAGFIVERSIDGKVFEKVSYVEGKGNSTQTSTYSLSDANAFANANAKTLYYRLVQTDFSGEETISQVVSVNANTDEETITALYPNPFNNELTFTIDSKVISTAKILVMDITGKRVVELTQTLTTGMNTIETAQLSQLTKGVYMVQLSVNGQLTTHKLVKQ